MDRIGKRGISATRLGCRRSQTVAKLGLPYKEVTTGLSSWGKVQGILYSQASRGLGRCLRSTRVAARNCGVENTPRRYGKRTENVHRERG